MTTFLTVLRGGGRYDASWVRALMDSVAGQGFARRAVLTDLDICLPGVETIRLRHDWPAWWAKIEAFRPGLLGEAGGPVVLCDLDTLITGDVSCLAEPCGVAPPLLAMEDRFLSGRVSTALLRWEGDALAPLYAAFAAAPERWMRRGSCGPVPNAVHGDQVFVDAQLRARGMTPVFVQDAHPGLIDFFEARRGVRGPLTVFVGEVKPSVGPDGRLHPPKPPASARVSA